MALPLRRRARGASRSTRSCGRRCRRSARTPGSSACSARTLRTSANERATTSTRPCQQLRDEIAAVDRAILDDVNARIELVAKIRSYKADAGLPFVDRDRERELIEALGAQNAGPLSADGLRELYTYLLDLTKREVGGDGAR